MKLPAYRLLGICNYDVLVAVRVPVDDRGWVARTGQLSRTRRGGHE